MSTKAQPRNRTCFARQPARMLLVDLSPPFDSSTYQVVVESLSHFLALACSLPGPCRLPFFGLSALGTYPEMLYPLQSVRGNFGRLRSALSEMETCMNSMKGSTSAQSSVGQGVREAANAFKRQANNMMQMAGYWTQLELTVLTCQSPTVVVRQVDQAATDLSLDVLKKAQVVHLNLGDRSAGPPEGTASSQTSNGSASTSNESDGLHGLVEWLTLDEDTLSLENFFKGWLQDCSTDVEHLHLILSSEPGIPLITTLLSGTPDVPPSSFPSGSEMVLKCDLHERLLSPTMLPTADPLSIHCDNPLPSRPGNPGLSKGAPGNQQQVPVYRLRAARRVQAEGVCESVLYGLPVIVRPTSCWKIDWDDLETNQHHFTALCRLLKEKDEYLLAVTDPPPQPVSTSAFRYQVAPPSPRGYFLLLPTGGASLLLKAAGVSALTLPTDLPPGDEPQSASLSAVGAALGQLEESNTYNPLLVTSGLYQCLEAHLTKNQPPVNTATKRKCPVPVIKPASSVPRRPIGHVPGNQSNEPWDRSGQLAPPTGNKRRHHQASGRDFYGRSGGDFPTEL